MKPSLKACVLTLVAVALVTVVVAWSSAHIAAASGKEGWIALSTWLTGLGTLLLVLGAAATAVIAYRTFKDQQAQQLALVRQSMEERLRDQARYVASYVEGHRASLADSLASVPMTLINRSNLPVFNVYVSVVIRTTQSEVANYILDVLPPTLDSARSIPLKVLDHDHNELDQLSTVLYFTDCGGVRWSRELDGTLTRAFTTSDAID